MEITLADLLSMEPRLRLEHGATGAERGARAPNQTAVSWAVTARTTVPHLPPLRGGELVLVPQRAMAVIGDALAALLRECAARDVSGVVLPDDAPHTTYPESGTIWFIRWGGALTAESETDINRLLTQLRGDLYRIGTELERRMTDVAAMQAGLGTLAPVIAETTGLGMAVADARGRRLAEAHGGGVSDETGDGIRGDGQDVVRRELARGAKLSLTAEEPKQAVVARFLIDRIAAAANAALLRDDAAKPRGPRRAEAMAGLLAGAAGNTSGQRALALSLGFDPDAVYVVAASDIESVSTVARALAPLGTAHHATGSNGRQLAVVAATQVPSAASMAARLRDVTARWEREPETARHWLALSSPALGVASLPRAAREAEFVAAMQTVGDVTRPAAVFGSVEDLGAMGLLYHLRESAELRSFVGEALGALPDLDQRGTLRSTLRAFLESGGSQVDASLRLGIHRNTLAYRLRRIGGLVGRDVADPSAWLTLHLALRAADVLETLADNP